MFRRSRNASPSSVPKAAPGTYLSTSAQLLATPAAVPFYEPAQRCPACIGSMTSTRGASTVGCSLCQERCPNAASDAWALPSKTCGSCGTVVCGICNQTLAVQALIEEGRKAAKLKVRKEEAAAAAKLASHKERATAALTELKQLENAVLFASSPEAELKMRMREDEDAITKRRAEALEAQSALAREASHLRLEAAVIRRRVAAGKEAPRELHGASAALAAGAHVQEQTADSDDALQLAELPNLQAEADEASKKWTLLRSELEEAAASTKKMQKELADTNAEARKAMASQAAATADILADLSALRARSAKTVSSLPRAHVLWHGRVAGMPDRLETAMPDVMPLEPEAAAAHAIASPVVEESVDEESSELMESQKEDAVPGAETPHWSSQSGPESSAMQELRILQGQLQVAQQESQDEARAVEETQARADLLAAEADSLRSETEEYKVSSKREAARCAHLRAELARSRVQSTNRKQSMRMELEDTIQSHSRRLLTMLSVLQMPATEAVRQEGWLEQLQRALAEFEAEVGTTP